jgi:3-mercaptopyruvate sulfurtransferase SseA
MAAIPPRASLLVDTEALAERLGDPRLRIVDIRGAIKPPTAPKPWYAPKRDAYLAAHIPGAVFVDWTEASRESTAPGRAPTRSATSTPGPGSRPRTR